jgi:hypothetical protein
VNLNKSDAQWLVNFYYPKSKGRIDATTINMFTKAVNLIRGSNTKVPSCSCEWKQTAALAHSYYGQYQGEIEAAASKRTKKTKNAV